MIGNLRNSGGQLEVKVDETSLHFVAVRFDQGPLNDSTACPLAPQCRQPPVCDSAHPSPPIGAISSSACARWMSLSRLSFPTPSESSGSESPHTTARLLVGSLLWNIVRPNGLSSYAPASSNGG